MAWIKLGPGIGEKTCGGQTGRVWKDIGLKEGDDSCSGPSPLREHLGVRKVRDSVRVASSWV